MACHEQAKRVEWLPGLDSNQDWVSQSHLCYHYTTRQRRPKEAPAPMRVKGGNIPRFFHAGWAAGFVVANRSAWRHLVQFE
jgi:hypothetical protein